ncbi:MAG: hypothetical protein ACI8RD_008174 [Bacillariaceae sp.]|jgi:hypothetical protein
MTNHDDKHQRIANVEGPIILCDVEDNKRDG